MQYFDTACYVISIVFFVLAGLNAIVTVGSPPERIKFEWLAFAMLVLSAAA